MLFIRGYYYFFAGFVYVMMAICEALHWLRKPHFDWMAKYRFSYRRGTVSGKWLYLLLPHP